MKQREYMNLSVVWLGAGPKINTKRYVFKKKKTKTKNDLYVKDTTTFIGSIVNIIREGSSPDIVPRCRKSLTPRYHDNMKIALT